VDRAEVSQRNADITAKCTQPGREVAAHGCYPHGDVFPVAWFVAVLFLAIPTKLSSAEGNCAPGDKPARPDCSRAIAFFSEFQTAFRENDRKKVAGLIEYPLLTSLRGKRVNIRGTSELLSHYDEIFDGGVRCAILGANAKSVWGTWQDFMIGNGEIWFDGIIPQREKPDPNSPDFWTK
jgi:hypothetical protein